MRRLQKDHSDSLDLIQLDVHNPDSEAMMQKLEFRFTPTFVLLDADGSELWRAIGSLDSDEISRQIDRHEP